MSEISKNDPKFHRGRSIDAYPINVRFPSSDEARRACARLRVAAGLTAGSASRRPTSLRNAGPLQIGMLARFASDYTAHFRRNSHEDPFQAVGSAFIRAAHDVNRTQSPIYKRFVSNASKAGKAIPSTAARIGTKGLTFGVTGSAEIDQLLRLKDELVLRPAARIAV